MSSSERPLWRCPECSRTFAATCQVHTCRPVTDLDQHFDNCEPAVREAFDAFVDAVGDVGPFEIVPQGTRIALHARMSFAALMPRRQRLNGHLVLAQPVDDPTFHRITTYSRHNHVHEFRLETAGQVEGLRQWIAAAYEVGMQRHHAAPKSSES